jgi:hypothetical protein
MQVGCGRLTLLRAHGSTTGASAAQTFPAAGRPAARTSSNLSAPTSPFTFPTRAPCASALATKHRALRLKCRSGTGWGAGQRVRAAARGGSSPATNQTRTPDATTPSAVGAEQKHVALAAMGARCQKQIRRFPTRIRQTRPGELTRPKRSALAAGRTLARQTDACGGSLGGQNRWASLTGLSRPTGLPSGSSTIANREPQNASYGGCRPRPPWARRLDAYLERRPSGLAWRSCPPGASQELALLRLSP